MKHESMEIGDNVAALLLVGGVLGFTGWLVKQAIDLALPLAPAVPFTVAELKRTETNVLLASKQWQ